LIVFDGQVAHQADDGTYGKPLDLAIIADYFFRFL
jgi:hypothetical protein